MSLVCSSIELTSKVNVTDRSFSLEGEAGFPLLLLVPPSVGLPNDASRILKWNFRFLKLGFDSPL